jgi:AAA15 family ATPase/GTPase
VRIQSLHLENFKRFTNLTIKDIPETAKLVLLIGGNGSGKSCVFDAFDWMNKNYTELVPALKQRIYYRKNVDAPAQASIRVAGKEVLTYRDDTVVIDGGTFGSEVVTPKFFGRSSIRIIPEITNTANPTLIATDGDAPISYIHHDTRFVNDIFRYIEDFDKAVREPIFNDVQADTRKIFREFIEPLNSSLRAIFGENTATTIQVASIQSATPTTPAKPVFRKGDALINYDLLSHGEKQVVILLLNFIVRKKYYEDAIIFIDEMDCHLNTTLQFNLLKEIVTEWIPDTAQLWTASHALGFIDYARSSDEAVTIDFDLLDFDVPQTLVPVSKESIEAYDIAIPKHLLGKLLADRTLVFCENKNAVLLNCLTLPQTLFVGVNNSNAVFLSIKHDSSIHGLRDRDFLTDNEIIRLTEQFPKYHILRYYCFENYLYHPDNIAELDIPNFYKEQYIQELTILKNQRKDVLLMSVEHARSRYEEFKNDGEKVKDKDITDIARSLVSDIFEEWYKFFSMKDGARASLMQFNLKQQDLVQTSWFKTQITQILENKV